MENKSQETRVHLKQKLKSNLKNERFIILFSTISNYVSFFTGGGGGWSTHHHHHTTEEEGWAVWQYLPCYSIHRRRDKKPQWPLLRMRIKRIRCEAVTCEIEGTDPTTLPSQLHCRCRSAAPQCTHNRENRRECLCLRGFLSSKLSTFNLWKTPRRWRVSGMTLHWTLEEPCLIQELHCLTAPTGTGHFLKSAHVQVRSSNKLNVSSRPLDGRKGISGCWIWLRFRSNFNDPRGVKPKCCCWVDTDNNSHSNNLREERVHVNKSATTWKTYWIIHWRQSRKLILILQVTVQVTEENVVTKKK